MCDYIAQRCPLLADRAYNDVKMGGKHRINNTWVICKSMEGHQASEQA